MRRFHCRRGRRPIASEPREAGSAAIEYNDAFITGIGARAAAASGGVASIALLAVTGALIVVAVVVLLRMRADSRRDARARQNRAGLARAYAELAAAKAAAEARSSQLEAILGGMSDGVMMLDADDRLVQWNDRFPEITGVPRAILKVGVAMADMVRAQAEAGEFPNGLPNREAEVALRMAKLGLRQHSVIERERPNGRVIELRRNPLSGGGTVTLYTDITARRRADAAQRQVTSAAAELVAQKAQFVAMVCHEVATPLEAVLECLDQLESRGPPPPALRRARATAELMAELLRDILDLAQLDAGRLTLRPADYDLAELLGRVAENFAQRAAERSMRLVIEIDRNLPERLHGDAGRLRQVLANYVSNAIKYSRPGEIRLRASRLDLGAPQLRLAVADRGPPLTPAEAALLFKPFTRLPDRSAEAAGTGLGLAICERLARVMEGAVGHGTAGYGGSGAGNEFWLAVPLARAVAADPGEPEGTGLAPRRRRSLVLLVEDLVVNQLVIATRLRRHGHHVDLASSGEEAVRLARQTPYDVVLTDLMMPGMSGFDVARAIRALPGAAATVPIYALTATTSEEDRAACRTAGMQGMLGKPVEAAALSDALAADRLPAPVAIAPPPPRRLVDAVRLAELREGLPQGVMTELADQCVSDIRAQMAALQAALAGDEARPVEAAAHAIAGMAGNYGLQAIEARMRRIMAAARAGDLAAARAAAAGREDEIERSFRALDLLLQLHDA